MDLQSGEKVIYQGHPSWRAIVGFYLKGFAVGAVAGALAALINEGVGLGIVTFVIIAAITIVVGFIKRVATVYTITDRRLNIKIGIIARKIQETRLQRVQNVNFTQGVYERVMQVGNVDFDTAGTDDSDFTFDGVSSPARVVQAVDHAQHAAAGTADDGMDSPGL